MPKPRARKTERIDGSSREAVKSRREQFHLGAEDVKPTYANWAQVAATNHDFKLVFGEVTEGTKSKLVTREVARIYMTPRMAKALLGLLAKGVERFESDHGVIVLNDVPIGRERTTYRPR